MESPPPPPRQVPRGITGSPSSPALALIGFMFAIFGLLTLILAVAARVTEADDSTGAALVPIAPMAIGLACMYYAWYTRERRRRLYHAGVAAVATIERVGHSAVRQRPGGYANQIGWAFEVDERRFVGERSSLNPELARAKPKDAIWVLYDTEDPRRNMEWPPL